jgi:hypothetical protein
MLTLGCGPTTRSYSVVIKNDGAEPMTCWLTKDGPPAEPQWLSPEQIAIGGAPKNETVWALIIKPGATAETPKPVSGQFESGTSAVHAVNERIDGAWEARKGEPLSHRARLTIGLILLALCMFAAGQFGLVDLIAKGYRALAYIFLAVFVLPLLTIGVWRIFRRDRAGDPALQN